MEQVQIDADVLRLFTLTTGSGVELDALAILEGLVPIGLDRREVDEHVVTQSREMKPKPFSALKNFTVPCCTDFSFLCSRSTKGF